MRRRRVVVVRLRIENPLLMTYPVDLIRERDVDRLREGMRLLPAPTVAQCVAFAGHVCGAHSWYKHLPFEGGRFVVFLAADAGERYPLQHPRLGPEGNSTELYRARFGHLDYGWRVGTEVVFGRDGGGGRVELPDGFVEQFGVTLYPYAAHDWAGVEVLCGRFHREAMTRLREGAPHPARGPLLRMAELYDEADRLWRRLSDEEREIACAAEDGPPGDVPEAVRAHAAVDAECHAIYWALQAGERAKVEGALARLRGWVGS